MMSLIPIGLPLVLALLVSVLPLGRSKLPWARWLAALGSLLSAVGVVVVVALGLPQAEIPLGSPYAIAGRALVFGWDGLSAMLAILLAAGVSVRHLLLWWQPLPSYRAGAILVAVGSALGVCAATDLTTLCAAFGIYDLAFLVMGLVDAPEEHVLSVRRQAWGHAVALVLLILALLLLAFDQGRTGWAYLALEPHAFILVVLAAWLRLGVFPLPAAFGTRWPDALYAICTGGYLWLRLGSVAPETPGGAILVAVGAAGLLVTASTAALSPNLPDAMPAIIWHGLLLAVLAPMLDTISGFSVAMLVLANLALAVAALSGARLRPFVSRLGRWQRIPEAVALVSLAGGPLTLGFAGHWLFLRVCLMAHAWTLFLVATLSFAALVVATGRVLRWLSREQLAEQTGPWQPWLGLAIVAVPALILVLVGLNPAWLERIWQDGYPVFDLPSIGALLAGPPGTILPLLFATLGVPALGVFAWLRLGLWLRTHWSDATRRLSAILRLEWLYLGLEEGLVALQRLSRRIIGTTEESFVMGLTLVWAAAVLLILVKR